MALENADMKVFASPVIADFSRFPSWFEVASRRASPEGAKEGLAVLTLTTLRGYRLPGAIWLPGRGLIKLWAKFWRPSGRDSHQAASRGFPSPGSRESGVSLLEVLIAVTILGLSFTAIFSGLSAALRTADTLGRYNRIIEYSERKVDELALDPTLEPGQDRFGVSDSGIRWRATTQLADERPSFDPERPAQLIRISLEVSWATRAGKRSFTLQTIKLRVPEAPPLAP